MKISIFIAFIIGYTSAICVPGMDFCPEEQHVGACYKNKKLQFVIPPGGEKINILHTACKNIRVAEGGPVDEYKNQIVGVSDSEVTFPLITVRYAICPNMYKNVNGKKKFDTECIQNVTTLLTTAGENFEDVLIEEEILNKLNSVLSTWTTEEVYITRFHELEDIIHTFLQTNIDRRNMPLTITRVSIPKKPLLDKTQSERFRARAEKQRVIEESHRDQEKVNADHKQKKAIEQSVAENNQIKKKAELDLILMEYNNQIDIAKKKKEVEEINAETLLIKAKAEADANKLKLTQEFLMYEYIKSMSKIEKIYFGDKVPNMVLPVFPSMGLPPNPSP